MSRSTPLSNEEKETIINFDETSAPAHIFTYSKTWQTHLEKRLGLKPIRDNGFGGKEYEIDKHRIRPPRAPMKLSAEQKRKTADRLLRGRRQKSPNFGGKNTTEGKAPPKRAKGV